MIKRPLAALALALAIAPALGVVSAPSAQAGSSSVSIFCKQAPSLYFKWAHCNTLKANTRAQRSRSGAMKAIKTKQAGMARRSGGRHP